MEFINEIMIIDLVGKYIGILSSVLKSSCQLSAATSQGIYFGGQKIAHFVVCY